MLKKKQSLESGGAWVPQLLVLKGGEVVDHVLLHGKEVFVLGRHQNCDIVACHASVSRHHLEIRVSCKSRELKLTDMRSVHGTKINGKIVHPLVATPMYEDDKLQIGASTRTYMVKWIPVTPEASDSSSSSCTPAKSVNSSLMRGFEEEFQSVLRISKSPATNGKQHPDSASRRLAFSELNGNSPRSNSNSKPSRMSSLGTSPMSKKTGVPDGSPKPRKVSESPKPRKPSIISDSRKSKKGGVLELPGDSSASKLWLRRCNSNPLPAINTGSKAPEKLPPCGETADDILAELQAEDDEYPSDKENVAPPLLEKVLKPQKSSVSLLERQPFKPLFYLPSPGAQSDFKPVFEPAPFSSSDDDSLSRMETAAFKNNRRLALGEQVLRKQIQSDATKQWHIVVDTNCFIDEDAFQALKQLEGIKETRVLVPKIVVRELDHLKRTKEKEYRARGALKWIEKCMVKSPWWIHVQNSYEAIPVVTTPPVSPSFLGRDFSQFGSAMDLMSPTNDDHILDCALLFHRSIHDGRVVLLTSDTALKIKAMAEGLCSEDSKTFCNSLLSPYSERFLWAGSTALRTPRSPPEGTYHPLSNRTGGDDHHHHLQEQLPKGLQLVLT